MPLAPTSKSLPQSLSLHLGGLRIQESWDLGAEGSRGFGVGRHLRR